MRRHITIVGAVVLGAQALGAQGQANRFAPGAHVGVQLFDRGTALQNSPFVGFDATHSVPWNPLASLVRGSSIGVSLRLELSRPATRGDQFAAVAVDLGDTTFLYAVTQRVTLLQGGVEAVVGAPMGPLRVYGFVGTGVYSIVPDSRTVKTNGSFTHPMASFGGGLSYPISAQTILRAQLRAVTLTKFDRERLDAGTAFNHDSRFRDALPAADATSGHPTNVQLSIAVQYRRRGR